MENGKQPKSIKRETIAVKLKQKLHSIVPYEIYEEIHCVMKPLMASLRIFPKELTRGPNKVIVHRSTTRFRFTTHWIVPNLAGINKEKCYSRRRIIDFMGVLLNFQVLLAVNDKAWNGFLYCIGIYETFPKSQLEEKLQFSAN